MTTDYSSAFFQKIRQTSQQSAAAIAPLVYDLVRPSSILDVGCGSGAWLASFARLGLADHWGVDGDWVPATELEIARDRFKPFDLSQPLDLGRSFDLVMSLEVAEHLPESAARTFVASLVRHSGVILFSAAIPMQGGTDHRNERWPEYWRDLFAAHGYAPVDAIREKVWNDPTVAWWYSQNAFFYVTREALMTHERLSAAAASAPSGPMAIVHPLNYLRMSHSGAQSLRGALGVIPSLAYRAIVRRLRRPLDSKLT
jgi:SAM-dependent methyltransferase